MIIIMKSISIRRRINNNQESKDLPLIQYICSVDISRVVENLVTQSLFACNILLITISGTIGEKVPRAKFHVLVVACCESHLWSGLPTKLLSPTTHNTKPKHSMQQAHQHR
jgi:hypothetical protein